jgi:hypothetical protein
VTRGKEEPVAGFVADHVQSALVDVVGDPLGRGELAGGGLVGVSFYRSGRNHTTYADRLRALVRDHDKPVVITEFGCGAFTRADQRGAGSFWIVNWFAVPPRIRGDHPRDEAVQARYLGELIGQYDTEGVHGCFVFTFAMPDFPHHDDPRLDLDLDLDLDKAGFGVVAVTGDGAGRPKEAFHEVARRYGDIAVEE